MSEESPVAGTEAEDFPDRFVSRSEVKAKLGISEEQLRREENKDGWPPAYLIGRRKKYRGADLNKYVESRKVTA